MTTVLETPATSPTPPGTGPRRVSAGALDPAMIWRSLPDAFRKLNPATLYKNPVMFIVEIGSVYTTWLAIRDHTAFVSGLVSITAHWPSPSATGSKRWSKAPTSAGAGI